MSLSFQRHGNTSFSNLSFSKMRQASDIHTEASWRTQGMESWIVQHDEMVVVIGFLDVVSITSVRCCSRECFARFSQNDIWEMLIERDLTKPLVIRVVPSVPFPNPFYYNPEDDVLPDNIVHPACTLFDVEHVLDGDMPIVIDGPEFVPVEDTVTFKLKYVAVTDEDRENIICGRPEHPDVVAKDALIKRYKISETTGFLPHSWSTISKPDGTKGKLLRWRGDAKFQIYNLVLGVLNNPYSALVRQFKFPVTYWGTLTGSVAQAERIEDIFGACGAELWDTNAPQKSRIVGVACPVVDIHVTIRRGVNAARMFHGTVRQRQDAWRAAVLAGSLAILGASSKLLSDNPNQGHSLFLGFGSHLKSLVEVAVPRSWRPTFQTPTSAAGVGAVVGLALWLRWRDPYHQTCRFFRRNGPGQDDISRSETMSYAVYQSLWRPMTTWMNLMVVLPLVQAVGRPIVPGRYFSLFQGVTAVVPILATIIYDAYWKKDQKAPSTDGTQMGYNWRLHAITGFFAMTLTELEFGQVALLPVYLALNVVDAF